MDFFLISIDYREPAWIAIAFLSGLLVRQVNLPPMVGFLMAGFVLQILGAKSGPFLLAVADMGVTLLLFTIGLKLRLNTLLRREIWATAGVHMAATVAMVFAAVMFLGWAGVLLFNDLDYSSALIVAFALSFSSTVFAVKILEDRASIVSRYGQVVIGILVIQDIAAVVFLAASAGKLPSPWAIGLLALIPARHVLGYVMGRSGRKELLAVFGFSVALGGAALFELVGMKGDLGALIVGAALAPYERAKQLSKILMNFKDLFLVCFFLTIGLSGLPSWSASSAVLIFLLLVPIKALLFVLLLLAFRMRARGALLGGMLLGNYSEFGLIVASIAIGAGWLLPEWLTVISLALTASLVLSAIVNAYADSLHSRFYGVLSGFERSHRLPGDEDIDLGGHRVLIFGMGRVGQAAYDELKEHAKDEMIGIDFDEVEVRQNCLDGRKVVQGDATSPEFWSRLITPHAEIEMIFLSMPHHKANLDAAKRMRDRGYNGPIVATAFYVDQEEELLANGVDEVFNFYAEAGVGAAQRIQSLLGVKAG